MYAGALSLVLSLWRVDSIATRNLMGIFYAFLRDGYDIAKSLQLSMNELRKTESFAHPYFWASFVLIGS
jgi:CHAT domain-containing protein